MPADYSDLIGIPYAYGSDDGLDCYAFARRVLSEKFGTTAPSYEFHGPEDDSWIAFAAHKMDWSAGDGSPGDVVLLRIGKFTHCGVMIGGRQMIHNLKGHHSCIESLDNIKWRDRIIGFYQCPT